MTTKEESNKIFDVEDLAQVKQVKLCHFLIGSYVLTVLSHNKETFSL